MDIGSNVPEALFGAMPRSSSALGTWKAAECKQLLFHYTVIVVDGHVTHNFLTVLKCLSDLVKLSSPPSLTDEQDTEMRLLARLFVTHIESDCSQYNESRVSICKLILHQIIFLDENVRR